MNYPAHLNYDELARYAFLAGDGLGQDVQVAITDLIQLVACLRDQLGQATALLGTCHAWLHGEQTKTIKGRREAAHSLANRMASQGLGYPQH